MERYNIITEKNPREIVLLRGLGCVYRKCLFCDYYRDSSRDPDANFAVNEAVLSKITGKYGNLEVINSGSVFELDEKTMNLIQEVCRSTGIHTIHFEAHYLYQDRIGQLRQDFRDFELKMKLGLETFDYDFREGTLHKGISERDPRIISRNFDEANFLFGIKGQTLDTMKRDIALGLACFDRICVNIMCQNTSSIAPDRQVIQAFQEELYPVYKANPRIDILLNNTDFGVGD